MRVLVDFDNIPPSVKREGPVFLADRILELLHGSIPEDGRIDMRLYGGWFAEDRLTRPAQELTATLSQQFPYPLWRKIAGIPRLIPVTAVLAHSLEALPRKLLYHTYRDRPPARRMSCDSPTAHGCTATPCKIAAIVEFVNTGGCPEPDCRVTTKHLFRAAGGQKLVDTMLVADLVHLSGREKSIAVLTSDDDIWPGIILALVSGTHIIHVRTGSATSGINYLDGVPGKYTQVSL